MEEAASLYQSDKVNTGAGLAGGGGGGGGGGRAAMKKQEEMIYTLAER